MNAQETLSVRMSVATLQNIIFFIRMIFQLHLSLLSLTLFFLSVLSLQICEYFNQDFGSICLFNASLSAFINHTWYSIHTTLTNLGLLLKYCSRLRIQNETVLLFVRTCVLL